MDVLEIMNRTPTAWEKIELNYKNGEEIFRDDILKALQSGEAVPITLNALIHAVISGEYKFKPGLRGKSKVQEAIIIINLDSLEMIEQGITENWPCFSDLHKESKLHGDTPRAVAKRYLAQSLNISERQLEKYLTEQKNIRKEILQAHKAKKDTA